MSGYQDLFELAFRGADDAAKTAAGALSPALVDDMVASLRGGDDIETWIEKVRTSPDTKLDQATKDLFDDDVFIMRAKATAELAEFSDTFKTAFNSKDPSIDVNVLIKNTDLQKIGLSKDEIKDIGNLFKERVEARTRIIENRMVRLEKINNPESVRTNDEILSDKDLRASVLDDWVRRYNSAAERTAAQSAVTNIESMTARPVINNADAAARTTSEALESLAMPTRNTNFNIIKVLTMKTFLERWFKDGTFKAFSKEGMDRAIPIKTMRARSTEVTEPVIARVDKAMTESGISKALLALDSHLLQNPNIDDVTLHALLGKFAEANKNTLEALSNDIQKLREQVQEWKTNETVGLRNDFTEAQQTQVLAYLDDMKSMYNDLAQGASANYITDLKGRLTQIKNGELTVSEVQNSPIRLFKGAYNAFQAEIRMSPERTIPGTTISATKQWVKQLSRQFDEGVYDANAHMAKAEVIRKHLKFDFLNRDNVERGVYNQFADLFSSRRSDGTLVYDFIGDVKPVSAFFNNTVEFIQNGYGSEVLFQVDRLKRLAQAPGMGDNIPLPPAGEFNLARKAYGQNHTETASETVYFDQIEQILEDAVLKGEGHEKSYFFAERFKKNLFDVNRQNVHLAATYAEPYELAFRFQNHDAMSTPGWDIYFKQYLKFKGMEAVHYFAGADSFKPGTKQVHGVEMNDYGKAESVYLKKSVDPKSGDETSQNFLRVPARVAYRGLTGGITSLPGRTIAAVTGVPLALGGGAWYALNNLDDENLGANTALAGLDATVAPWRAVANVVTTPYEVAATAVVGLAESNIQDESFFDTYAWNEPLISTGLEGVLPGGGTGGVVNKFWDFLNDVNPTNDPTSKVTRTEGDGTTEEEVQEEPESQAPQTLEETKALSAQYVQNAAQSKIATTSSYDALIRDLRNFETSHLATIDQAISNNNALGETEKVANFQLLRTQITDTVSATATGLTAERNALLLKADAVLQSVEARDALVQSGTDKIAADMLILEQRGAIATFVNEAQTAIATRQNELADITNKLHGGLATGQAVANVPALTALGIVPDPAAGGKVDPADPAAGGKVDPADPAAGGKVDPADPAAGGKVDPADPAAGGKVDPATPAAPLSPLQEAQNKAAASEQYFQNVVNTSRNSLNTLDTRLDEIEKTKDELYAQGKTEPADALGRALDHARAGQVTAESVLANLQDKRDEIRTLREQVIAAANDPSGLDNSARLAQTNGLLEQMRLIQSDVTQMGKQINTVGNQVFKDLASTDELLQHEETQQLIRNISGGEYGLINQYFGSDDPSHDSVVGSYLNLAWNKVQDVGDWWQDTKDNARDQDERNMLNLIGTGGQIFAGLMVFNMINEHLFNNQIGGIAKWGILASVVGYFLHESGKDGADMAKQGARHNPFAAQGNFGSTSTATPPPSGGGSGAGSSARSSHTPFSRSTTSANTPQQGNGTTVQEADNAVPIRDKTGQVINHIKVDLSGGVDKMTVQSHAGGMPQGPNNIMVTPEAKSEISRVVSGQCKFMVPDGDLEGSITIDRIQNSDGTNLQGPVSVDFTCPAANSPEFQAMASGQ